MSKERPILFSAPMVRALLAGETELARIWTKVEAIRAKQAAKPQFGPLPGYSEPNMEMP